MRQLDGHYVFAADGDRPGATDVTYQLTSSSSCRCPGS